MNIPTQVVGEKPSQTRSIVLWTTVLAAVAASFFLAMSQPSSLAESPEECGAVGSWEDYRSCLAALETATAPSGGAPFEIVITGDFPDRPESGDNPTYSRGDVDLVIRSQTGLEQPPIITGTRALDGGADGDTVRFLSITHDNATVSIEGLVIRGFLGQGFGGAVALFGDASLVVESSTLEDNRANEGSGGAIRFVSGSVTLIASTLASNVADSSGGAIAIGGSGSLRVVRSTIVGNAAGTGSGGAVYTFASGAQVTLINATVARNSAAAQIFLQVENTLTSFGSVYSGQSTNCFPGTSGGSITVHDAHSWDDDGSCFGNADGDPELGDLLDNGGPTPTILPRAGSPLIGAIPGDAEFPVDSGNLMCGDNVTYNDFDLSIDQRALPRTAPCDIGAVQLQWTDVCDAVSESIEYATCLSMIDRSDPPAENAPFAITIVDDFDIHLDDFDGDPFYESDASLTIIGNGHTITGTRFGGENEDDPMRFLDFDSEDYTLRIENLTVTAFHTDDGGGGAIRAEGNVEIISSVLSHNLADELGGALYVVGGVVAIESSVFEDNESARGGALATWPADTTVANSRLSSNSANDSDGGGGAIFASGAGSLTIVASTIERNEAENEGGALLLAGTVSARIVNTTIANNSATLGGAMYSGVVSVEVSIEYSTVVGNSASAPNEAQRSQIRRSEGSPLTIFGSVIESSEHNCTAAPDDIQSAIVAAHSWADDPSCFAADSTLGLIVDTENPPGLTAVDEGDVTLWYIPDWESPLVDRIDPDATFGSPPAVMCGPTASAGLRVDQLGATRPFGSACDIGAVELVLGLEVCDTVVSEETYRSCLKALNTATPPTDDPFVITIAKGFSFDFDQDDRGAIFYDNDADLVVRGECGTENDDQCVVTGTRGVGEGPDGDPVRFLNFNSSGNKLTIENLHITRFHVSGDGGAILAVGDVAITDSVLSFNLGTSQGGAIRTQNSSLTIKRSELLQNQSNAVGGAVYSFNGDIKVVGSRLEGNTAGSNGGAILAQGTTDITVLSSTLHANTAGSNGGAIWAASGTTRLVNSTISGNVGGSGSAVWVNAAQGALEIVYSTVVDNHGAAQLLLQSNSVEFSVFGSVIAAEGANCGAASGGVGVDVAAFNWADDSTCFGTTSDNVVDGVDPLLGTLGDNGGPTPTRLPEVGSPLVARIPDGTLFPGLEDDLVCGTDAEYLGLFDLTLDQRGEPRTAPCDIGAVAVLHPGITLEKTVLLGDNPEACPGEEGVDELVVAPLGTAVVYCFRVVNTGKIELAPFTVDDLYLGIHLSSGAETLGPGESHVFHYLATVDADLVNEATALGDSQSVAGHPLVADTNTAEVKVEAGPPPVSGPSCAGVVFTGASDQVLYGANTPVVGGRMVVNVSGALQGMTVIWDGTFASGSTGVYIEGSRHADTICGTTGDDIIYGRQGGDMIYGMGSATDYDRATNTGGDWLFGNRGRDLIVNGSPGELSSRAARIGGGPGGDRIHAGNGATYARGGRGADTIFGGSGAGQVLAGNRGRDTIIGGSGADQLLAGGRGNDHVIGGSGFGQTLRGGRGDDVLEAGTGGGQVLRAGRGEDRVFIGAGQGQVVFTGPGGAVVTANGPNDFTIV